MIKEKVKVETGNLTVREYDKITYVSNGIDEFKIIRIIKNNGDKFVIYHKNKIKNTREYHKHKKEYASYKDAISYCEKHKEKYFKKDCAYNLKQIKNIDRIDYLLKNQNKKYIKIT